LKNKNALHEENIMKKCDRILRKFVNNYYGNYESFAYWNDETVNNFDLRNK